MYDDISGLRSCRGGFPLKAFIHGDKLRKRALIRDFYHGVYQVVIQSQQYDGDTTVSVEMHNHSTLFYSVRFIHSMDVITLNRSMNFSELLTTSESTSPPVTADTARLIPFSRPECRFDDFIDISDEWNGEWIRLSDPVGDDEPSIMSTGARMFIDDSVDANRTSLCPSRAASQTLSVCSGQFPSAATSPTSFTHPWVYTRSSCYFHQYSVAETWRCLNHTWIVMIGDSNLQDWVRNLVGTVLGVRSAIRQHGPRGQDNVWHSSDGSGSVRITHVWDGSIDVDKAWDGFFTFNDQRIQTHLASIFDPSLNVRPDFIFFNEGLHDAAVSGWLDRNGGWMHDLPFSEMSVHRNIIPNNVDKNYTVVDTIQEWDDAVSINSYRLQVRRTLLYLHRLAQGYGAASNLARSRWIWRTTIAPGGEFGRPSYDGGNVYTLRQFNDIVVQEMKRYYNVHHQSNSSVIRWMLNDQYDLTYAWSSEPLWRFSDTGHYGRIPKPLTPNPGEDCDVLHCIQNPFIEIMQVQVGMNIMCNT